MHRLDQSCHRPPTDLNFVPCAKHSFSAQHSLDPPTVSRNWKPWDADVHDSLASSIEYKLSDSYCSCNDCAWQSSCGDDHCQSIFGNDQWQGILCDQQFGDECSSVVSTSRCQHTKTALCDHPIHASVCDFHDHHFSPAVIPQLVIGIPPSIDLTSTSKCVERFSKNEVNSATLAVLFSESVFLDEKLSVAPLYADPQYLYADPRYPNPFPLRQMEFVDQTWEVVNWLPFEGGITRLQKKKSPSCESELAAKFGRRRIPSILCCPSFESTYPSGASPSGCRLSGHLLLHLLLHFLRCGFSHVEWQPSRCNRLGRPPGRSGHPRTYRRL
jgi:hypothetical protein